MTAAECPYERQGGKSDRVRSFVLSIVLCLFLCGPLILFGIEKLGVSLPDWVTSEGAAYLSGGMQTTSFSDVHDIRSLLKCVHADAEDEIGNHVPMKATALLANAHWQRGAISLSNMLWQWPCYPTSFGADHLYIPAQDAVCKWPRAVNPAVDEGLQDFEERLTRFAAAHKELTFVSFVVARSETSSANPARPLVPESYTASDVVSAMKEELGAGVVVQCEDPDSLDEYYKQFFRSDHHWRASGAVLAYNQLAGVLGKQQISSEVQRVAGPLYSGAYARNSLCLVEDEPTDLVYDFSDTLLGDGDSSEEGDAHAHYFGANEQNKHWRFYDLFYDMFPESRGVGEGKILLVCDSFGFALIRPLAVGYEEVIVVNALQASQKTDQSLEALLADAGFDTVLFVGDSGNFSTFYERNPYFFSIGA